MQGAAALYPDNSCMEEYGELSFSLYDDYSALDIFVSESSEWSELRGMYARIE
jgi:hypothetical protein